eukprot:sb/3470846/
MWYQVRLILTGPLTHPNIHHRGDYQPAIPSNIGQIQFKCDPLTWERRDLQGCDIFVSYPMVWSPDLLLLYLPAHPSSLLPLDDVSNVLQFVFSCRGQHKEWCGAVLAEDLPGRNGGSAKKLNPESRVSQGYSSCYGKQVDGDIPACNQLVSSQRLVEDQRFTFTRDSVEKKYQFHGFVGPVVAEEPLVGNDVEFSP